MRNSCTATRGLMTARASAESLPEVAEHLAHCASCARYSLRMREVRRLAREHHARLEPDEGFRGRLAARIPASPSGVTLDWAALRLLPATLLLLCLLSWLAWQSTRNQDALAEEVPTDNLPSWFLAQSESGT